MNIMYSNICQKLLGEYSEINKYHFQLLYLICYISGVKNVTDIDKILVVLKTLKLKKEAYDGSGLIYNNMRNTGKISEPGYGEDFSIRYELYYYSIGFDIQLMKMNCRLGFRKHKRVLENLYKICYLYCMVNVFKVGKNLRGNIYSCIRDKILETDSRCLN